MDFTAIDFETANSLRSSACSIGLVRVENDRIVKKFQSYIKPVPFKFNPINVQINGIDESHCKDAPTFIELWPVIKPYIENQTLVAHNYPFEESVLANLSEHFKIDISIHNGLCTFYQSRVKYPKLQNHKLPFIYKLMFDEEISHHDSLADAEACAKIAMSITNGWNPPSFDGMVNALYQEPKVQKIRRTKVKLAQLTPDAGYENNSQLSGKSFTFTGELRHFTREEAAQLVVNYGAKAGVGVTKSTTHLVIGGYDPSFGENHKSGKFKKAKEYIERGQNIQIISEDQFLDLTKQYS